MKPVFYRKDKNGNWVAVKNKRMRITNHTKISNDLIRAIVKFVRPPGIRSFYVVVKNTKRLWGGHGGKSGVMIKIGKPKYPFIMRTYQYGQLRGRRYYIANQTELLIYLLAHELMHTKQGQRGNCRGRVWGARGRFSEIETESYAIRKLREFRRS